MSTQYERDYIRLALMPEIIEHFDAVAKEYQQERDLGIRGEFANLYRKARKLKSIYWDGVPGTNWREGVRTIIIEVIAHGLLMLVDYDTVRPNDKALRRFNDAQAKEQDRSLADEDDEEDDPLRKRPAPRSKNSGGAIVAKGGAGGAVGTSMIRVSNLGGGGDGSGPVRQPA